MQYFTQVDRSLLFHGYGLHYNIRFNDDVILSRRKICNNSLRFIVHIILHGYGLQYNTRSIRVNEEIKLCFTVCEEDQFLCKISVNCSHCLPVFVWLWLAL